MAREYGWAPIGERAHDDKPGKRGRNISVLGTLTLQGLGAVMTLEGAVDGVAMLAYIQEVLAPTLKPKDIVFMDNLSSHKYRGIREAIEATGAQVVYLPPYSPDLNPIELCWSQLKTLLRSAAARTREALDDAIAEAMKCITGSDAAGWFRHAGY